MGSCRQLKTPGSDPRTQRGMGAIGPGHHDSNVGHLEQRQIVGGIPQGQDLHLLGTQMMLQGGQGLAFADAWAGGIAATVLLSPAAASFDQFDSFAARGDAFTGIVRQLAASVSGTGGGGAHA